MIEGDGRKGTCDVHPNKNLSAWRDYFDWMMQYAKKRVGPNDARAVANEALYDAYISGRRPSSFENESEIRRWLATLVCWRVRAHWSRERRAKNIDLCDLEEREDLHMSSDSESSDVVLDRLEILQVLPTLRAEDRTLVLERYVGGFSAPELAAKYGLNERTVRTRIDRAIDKLLQALRPRKGRYGFFFLAEPLLDNLPGKDLVLAARSWIAKWLRMPTLMGPSASATIMALSVSGTFPPSPVPTPEPEPLPVAAVISFSMPPQLFVVPDAPVAYAIPDKHVPERTQARRLPPQTPQWLLAAMAAWPTPAPEHAPGIGPITLPAPLTPPTLSSDAACSDAFADAQTAFNHRQDATACLQHLNRVPEGIRHCPETEERATLRRECTK